MNSFGTADDRFKLELSGCESVGGQFDEREQAEIIAHAAALQREHGQLLSLSDLERAATEAGIEPRFVREAVRLRSQSSRPAQPVVIAASVDPLGPDWRTTLAAAIFVPAELVVMRNLAAPAWSHRGQAMAVAFVVAVLFGLALPIRASARRIAGAWPLLVTGFFIFAAPGEWRFHHTWLVFMWWAAIQAAAAVMFHLARERRAGGR